MHAVCMREYSSGEAARGGYSRRGARKQGAADITAEEHYEGAAAITRVRGAVQGLDVPQVAREKAGAALWRYICYMVR